MMFRFVLRQKEYIEQLSSSSDCLGILSVRSYKTKQIDNLIS